VNSLKSLAGIIASHSIDVKSGENVLIVLTGEGLPLAKEVYRSVIEKGGNPLLRVWHNDIVRDLISSASRRQLETHARLEEHDVEWSHAVVNIVGHTNLSYTRDIPPSRISQYEKATKIAKLKVLEKKWLTCLFPSAHGARLAGMSCRGFEALFFKTILSLDWKRMERTQDGLKKKLDKGRSVRIVGKDTELSFNIEGRKAVKYSGRNNLPDGEVMIAPQEDSVEGCIRFDVPSWKRGKLVRGVFLEFRKGRVIRASARSNTEYLKRMLQTDKGASRVGEFAVGTNPGITRYTGQTLVDEKMMGTVHFALGYSYPETGGLNRSAIHWDLIKDLRERGAMYIDGKEVRLSDEG
jgi:aminopeptidase